MCSKCKVQKHERPDEFSGCGDEVVFHGFPFVSFLTLVLEGALCTASFGTKGVIPRVRLLVLVFVVGVSWGTIGLRV